jgi:hypothetical protein
MKETNELHIFGPHFIEYGALLGTMIFRKINVAGAQIINGGYYCSQ